MDKMSWNRRGGNDYFCLEIQASHTKEKNLWAWLNRKSSSFLGRQSGKDQGVPGRRDTRTSVFEEQARESLWLGSGRRGHKWLFLMWTVTQHCPSVCAPVVLTSICVASGDLVTKRNKANFLCGCVNTSVERWGQLSPAFCPEGCE